MKSIKIRVKGREHCTQIQEHLFSLGYRWSFDTTKVRDLDNTSYLYGYECGSIRYGVMDEIFDESMAEEVELVFKPSFETVKKRVQVFGVTYFEDDVKEALQKIQPAV